MVSCEKCGGDMLKTNKNEHNISLQIAAILVFLVGAALLFYPPIGSIAGVVIIIASTRMGFKRFKVWRCKSCGYFFQRD